MDTKAAVAFAAGAPLSIETVQLDGPQAGEVLIEVMATVCVIPMRSRYPERIPKEPSLQS